MTLRAGRRVRLVSLITGCVLWALLGGVLAGPQGRDVERIIAGNPDILPLRDYVVIRFNQPLDELRPKHRFGIFRDIEARNVQWIEEARELERLPLCERPASFLQIRYEVPTADSYNGWWLKLDNADWRPFSKCDLVLRLRLGQNCTRVFKLEIKAKEGQMVRALPAIVRIRNTHEKANEEYGFCDVTIPVPEIAAEEDLARMQELVFVFESNRIAPREQKGNLLLHSIRLAWRDPQQERWTAQQLLDDLARNAFIWLQEHRHPETGLVLDRSRNSPVRREERSMSSIASAGYLLSAYPEAVRTGQIEQAEAEKQSRQTLAFVLHKMPHRNGLLYHFVDAGTGTPLRDTEVSALDSAIFFNGCMVASEAFGGEVRKLADALVDRADWTAFVVKHPETHKPLLSLGWLPGKGLLGAADVRSSETAMAYFLAAGSRMHAVEPQLWYNTHVERRRIAGVEILNPTHPLFSSYYGLAWHRLENLVDMDGVDLWDNARRAAAANRLFCRESAERYVTYSPAAGGWWGISAGDSPQGYVAPGLIHGDANGTVWPMAALAAAPWSEAVVQDLAEWRRSDIWRIVSGPYGLAPFNLCEGWVGEDIIGIDVGSYYLSLANMRNRTIQNLWMRHPVAVLALERLGYRKTIGRDSGKGEPGLN